MIGPRIRLDGRVVLVAGAGGGGIGTSVCRAAAELGASVAGIDFDESALVVAEDAVTREGGNFLGINADVRRKDEVDAAVAAVVEAFGNVDGLVHVVGGEQPRHWDRLDNFQLMHLDEVFDLNVRSAFLTSQAVARQMIAKGNGGSIVHISSIAAGFAAPFNAAYALAKSGLQSLTRSMAVEWGRHGVRVNAVAAGTISTPHSRGNDAADEQRDSVLALKRRGTPEELAAAVIFVLTDLGSFVTGQVITVDGGSEIRPSYLGPDDLPVFMEDGDLRHRLLSASAGLESSHRVVKEGGHGR
jgi:NAD(P)-dependent dehydrogenase (short-subunit alcohol dehydrogenase family)